MRLGDPAAWGGWGHDGAIRFPDVRDRMYTADLRSDTDLENTGLGGFLSDITFGVNYSDRRKDKAVDEYDLFLKNGRQPTTLDPADVMPSTSLGFAGIPGILTYDADAIYGKYYDMVPIKNSDNYNKNWSIGEKIVTIFSMAKIDAHLGGIKLRGNAGVQIVHVTQDSSGYSVPGDITGSTPITPAFSTVSASYSNVLPSLNLIFDLGSDVMVRVGAARTAARPRLDDLRSSVSAGVSQTTFLWSGSGGNPYLRPWLADAYDLTLEKYFGNRSYFSVNGFYKKLNTYIYNQSVQFDFSNVPNTSPYDAISPIGLLTRPVNGQGGNIRGLEFSGTFDFGIIAKPLTGLGFTGSESLTWTGIKPSGPDSMDELPGFSHVVRNLTAFYENGGFSARISQRYRSAFRGEVVQLFTSLGYVQVAPDQQWDAQIGYTFQKGSPLAGLGFLLQANNVFNSPYRTQTTRLDGTERTFLPETYEEYGRQILFGANMKF
ncbi:MAG: TonB-dependent receptor domain-containing protein [Sphingomonas sp.]